MSTTTHRLDDSATAPADRIAGRTAQVLSGILRILIGFTFLWAFLDKAFAWGYSTTKAWLFGAGDGSPTAGFLAFGVNPTGPFADFFHGLAPDSPNGLVNWLFMAALLGAGVGLVLGIGMRISCIGAVVLLLSMWLAVAPWAKYVDKGGSTVASNNPLLDEHILYSVALLLLMTVMAGRYVGLGRWWESHTPAWLH